MIKKMRSIIIGTMASLLCVFVTPVWAAEVGPGANLPPQGESQTLPVEVGPGVGAGSADHTGAAGFLQSEIKNPIVQVQEKYSYDQMSQDIERLKNQYPNQIQVNVYGTSLDGRNLYDIIVGNPNAPKKMLIQGGIHAREYQTPLLIMKQLEDALAFYGSGTYGGRALSDMFQQVAIHFVPMTNPDGVTISQFGIEGIRSEELRQNIRACYEADVAASRTSAPFERYLTTWKANARGVDLNRNFDADWNNAPVTTAIPSYAGYKGTNPCSEPESAALAALGNQHIWGTVLNYHSMGQVIYWDTLGNNTVEASNQLARMVSATTGYTIYGTLGQCGYKDWIQVKENPAPSVTIEVGHSVNPVPVAQFQAIWSQNRAVWVQAMEFVLGR